MKGFAALALLAIAPVAFLACGARSSQPQTPQNRLILLDDSIGGIRLDEPRKRVEHELGRGTSSGRGVVSYFGGRLFVTYVFHDALTQRVEGLWTRWPGFHTRSGVRVGSIRQQLRGLHLSCNGVWCGRTSSQLPDAAGTGFEVRHGKIVEIDVTYG